MTTTIALDPRELASDATRRVLDAVLRDGEPVVIVDSPPGAGKTRLVVQLVASAVQSRGPPGPRRRRPQQADLRIARRLLPIAGVPIQILRSERSPLPPDLAGVAQTTTAAGLAPGPGVVLANVAKARISTDPIVDGSFDLLVVDESYQIPFADLLALLDVPVGLVHCGRPGAAGTDRAVGHGPP